MKTSLLVALLLLGAGASAVAQTVTASSTTILAEGLQLYASEKASWVATDLLVASQVKPSSVGGYLSYLARDSVFTIFWAPGATGTVGAPLLARYGFARQNISPGGAHRQAAARLTAPEARLWRVRGKVLAEINSGRKLGQPYRQPAGTALNVALLPGPAGMVAYVLTGPHGSQVLPIGNDYCLRFNQRDELISAERLHHSYLPLGRSPLPDGAPVEEGMHTHLAAQPFITPTDICSLLLYPPAGRAPRHVVLSEGYASVFDPAGPSLVIMSRKEFANMERGWKRSGR